MKGIKDFLMPKKHLIVLAAAIFLGLVLGYGLRDDDSGYKQLAARQYAPAAVTEKAEQTTGTSDHKPIYDGHKHDVLEGTGHQNGTIYVCPMNCVAPMGKPGKCRHGWVFPAARSAFLEPGEDLGRKIGDQDIRPGPSHTG